MTPTPAGWQPGAGPAPGLLRRLGVQRCGPDGRSCTLPQREADGGAEPATAALVRAALGGAGQPLPSAVRGQMEARFGHDFGRVRVHADERAAASAAALRADAYTVGEAVVFGTGRYHPGSQAGRRLLSHELAHVLQQRAARGWAGAGGPAGAGATERQASRVGDAIEASAPAGGAPVFGGPAGRRPAARSRLTVSEPSDPAEVQAAAVAEQLFPEAGGAPDALGAPDARPAAGALPAGRVDAAAGATCGSGVLRGVTADRGSPLPAGVRAEMEGAFGTGFAGVRIHTDGRAARLSRSLRAQAFTFGNDIFFDQGEYNPDTRRGKGLLAHELTHTVQQRGTLATLARQGGGRTALQCVNDNLASMGVAAWLITIVGSACALVGAIAGSPTGPGAAGTAAFGAVLCIAGLTGLSIGVVSRVVRECIRDPNVRVGLPGTLAAAAPPAGIEEDAGAAAGLA